MKLINPLLRTKFFVGMTMLLQLLLMTIGHASIALAETYAPGIELPLGDGQAVVRKACTKCHSLEGLPMYKGYYDRGRWLLFVETMIANGATLNEEEKDLVVDYLTENFGTN